MRGICTGETNRLWARGHVYLLAVRFRAGCARVVLGEG